MAVSFVYSTTVSSLLKHEESDKVAATSAIKAKFYTEMSKIDEQKEIAKVISFMDSEAEDGEVATNFLDGNLTVGEIEKLSDTLKAEIIFARNSFGNVVNWNNYNYALKGYYASIAF